jgi:diguanylate cyclase (GGDEF)-like protein/PAS domain S-box-containing protein
MGPARPPGRGSSTQADGLPIGALRPKEGRARITADDLAELEQRIYGGGVIATFVVVVITLLYCYLPGSSDQINYRGIWVVIAVTVLSAMVFARLPWAALRRRGWYEAALFAWGLIDIALIQLAVVFSGDASSQLWLLNLVFVAFNSLGLMVRRQRVVCLVAIAAYVVALGATGWQIGAPTAVVRIAVMSMVFLTGAWLTRELSLEMWGHGASGAEAHHREELLNTLATTVRAMAAADPLRVVDLALETLVELGFESCAFCVLEGDTGRLCLRSTRGLPEEEAAREWSSSEGVMGLALARHATAVVEDYHHGREIPAGSGKRGVRCAVATPVRQNGEVTGVLAGGTTRTSLTRQDSEVFELLAVELGNALTAAGMAETLVNTEVWYRSLVQNSSDVIFVIGDNVEAIYVSPSVVTVLGYAPEELLGSNLVQLIHPADVDQVATVVAQSGSAGLDHLSYECRVRHKGGWWRHVRTTLRDLTADPAVRGLVINARDVTEEVEAADEVRGRAAQAHAVAGLGQLALGGVEGGELHPRAVTIVAEAIGAELVALFEVVPSSDDPDRQALRLSAGLGWEDGNVGIRELPIDTSTAGHLAVEADQTLQVQAEDVPMGGRRQAPPALFSEHGVCSTLSVALTAGGSLRGIISVHSRVDRRFAPWDTDCLRAVANVLAAAGERERAEAKLQSAALHDHLTGLPNRVLLYDRLSHALVRLDRRPGHVAVLFIDLDRFKTFNDRYGHDRGDAVLTTVVGRLRAATRPSDTLGRLAGDELVLACEGVANEAEANSIAEQVVEVVRQPFTIGGVELVVTASVGVTLGGTHDDAETLISEADAAMYLAKRRGRDRHELFDDAMRRGGKRTREIERALRMAVELGQLELSYQPEVELATGETRVVTSRVAWRHPALGMIRSADFLPLAEETGTLAAIGISTLGESFRQVSQWRRQLPGCHNLRAAVDIPLRFLLRRDLVAALQALLERARLPGDGVVIEVTDGGAMRDSEAAVAVMEELHALGVEIIATDFGARSTSLLQLRRFPVDRVKIDRAFVSRIVNDPADRIVVEAMCSMAHAIGKEVVAGGVRSAEQADLLLALGADAGQGSYWCRPVKPATAERWLREHATGRSAVTTPAGRR